MTIHRVNAPQNGRFWQTQDGLAEWVMWTVVKDGIAHFCRRWCIGERVFGPIFVRSQRLNLPNG